MSTETHHTQGPKPSDVLLKTPFQGVLERLASLELIYGIVVIGFTLCGIIHPKATMTYREGHGYRHTHHTQGLEPSHVLLKTQAQGVFERLASFGIFLW